VTYEELSTQLVDHELWISNLWSFVNDHIMTKFRKNSSKSLDKLLICKEDKENLTKTRITLITQFFKYLSVLDD
jgi:hypothetical protein